jgi:hypothetical protein
MSGYTPNIPAASDRPSQSQAQILSNFQTLNSTYGVDHYDFTTATTNQGKHQKVTFPAQAGDPTTIANELALYAKNVGGDLGLYVREASNGQISQLFSSISSTIAAPNFVVLFDGLKLVGTTAPVPAFSPPNNFTVTYTSAFTTCFGVLFSAVRSSGAGAAEIALTSISNASCTFQRPAGGTWGNIFVVAFGV